MNNDSKKKSLSQSHSNEGNPNLNEQAKNVLSNVLWILATVITCLLVVNYNHEDLIIFSLLSVVLLIYWVYRSLFKNGKKRIFVHLAYCCTILVVDNKLYDYNALTTMIPILGKISSTSFIIIILFVALVCLLIYKLYKCGFFSNDNTFDNQPTKQEPVTAKQEPTTTSKSTTSTPSSSNSKVSNKNISISSSPIYMQVLRILLVLAVLSVSVCAFFITVKNFGYANTDKDFIRHMFNHAFYIIVWCFVPICVLLTIAILARILLAFTKNLLASPLDTKQLPNYFFSLLLTIAIFYLGYKNDQINLDKFYDLTSAGDFLAVPLMCIFYFICFILVLSVIHILINTLSLCTPAAIDTFLRKDLNLNLRAKVKDLVTKFVNIVYTLLVSILTFAEAIPDYFISLSEFVIADDDSNEKEINTSIQSKTNSNSNEEGN